MTTTIRKTRESLGVSLSELSKKTGIPKTTISDMETGRRTPSFQNLFKVVTTLNNMS